MSDEYSGARPTAPGPGGWVPRFGMFAGPGYTGGRVWGSGQVPDAQAWEVRPTGFLDDVTRTHDINYTYIEQTYSGNDAATEAARAQAHWQADKEMLANMLAYQPQNWLEAQYRKAGIQAFVAKADVSYAKHVDVVGEWNRDLAGIDPDFPAMPVTPHGRATWSAPSLVHAGATYTSTGMEALATSGVNVQVAMLFNPHIQPGNIAAQTVSQQGETSDPQAELDYSRRIMVPQRDPQNLDVFTAEGYVDGKWVTVWYDSDKNDLVRTVFSVGLKESETLYNGVPDSGLAGREYGHANFTVTRQNYLNGEPAGDPEALPPVKADELPALAESRHTQTIKGLVTQGEAAVYPPAPTAEDRAWQDGQGSLFPAPAPSAARDAGEVVPPTPTPAVPASAAHAPALAPELAARLNHVRQDLGEVLRSAGFSSEQTQQVCAATLNHYTRHAILGAPDRFMLSRDQQHVGVLHNHGLHLSEMPIEAAWRQSEGAHLAEAVRVQGRTEGYAPGVAPEQAGAPLAPARV